MQQGKQPLWVRLQLLARLTLNAGKDAANQPARLAHLDDGNDRAIFGPGRRGTCSSRSAGHRGTPSIDVKRRNCHPRRPPHSISPVEGNGFELPVREHRAMAPSHGFAAPSLRGGRTIRVWSSRLPRHEPRHGVGPQVPPNLRWPSCWLSGEWRIRHTTRPRPTRGQNTRRPLPRHEGAKRMDPLARRRLGTTEVEVTQLGFGGAGLGDLFEVIPEAQAAATLEAAWD